MYDFIVIGASLAGCSFALNISDTAHVLLLDKRDIFSDNLKDCKPCGGLISPDAQKELFKQNIPIDLSILEDPQLISILNYDFDNKKDTYFSRFYFNIDRQKFNQALLKKVLEKENCDFKREKVLSYEKLIEGYVVKTKTSEFKTKKIIIAQGWNNHLVSNNIKKEQYTSKYIVLQEWFQNTNKQVSTHSVVFDKSITDHYAWIVPKGDKFLLGVGINREKSRNYKKIFNRVCFQINLLICKKLC